MKHATICLVVASLAASWEGLVKAWGVEISIDPNRVLNRIDEKVYGHFLEHIFHSVNGGLWGEMIWDRSFEGGGAAAGSRWSIQDDCLLQKGMGDNVRCVFGDPKWTDYQFTLEAQKTGGQEGFLILFRVADQKQFYWANLGGWSDERHSLERGVKGASRWGPVGPAVPGKIEQGRWYRIRVRCEGPCFQVWLDDAKLIDFTDQDKAHPAGRVGVGTWRTQARFRNLKVATLDGKTLFKGLPELKPPAAAAHQWAAYGQGRSKRTTQQPLNGDWCQLLVCESGETGFQQTPLYIRKGHAYCGSLWARGDAPDGLVVRLLDGRKTLAEKVLPAPSRQWQEFSFELAPDATAENATIQVGLRGKGKVWLDQVSLMSEAARETGGFRPDLLKAVADLKPPIIRWPGGCFASLYLWKDGIGPQHKRVKYPRRIWDDVDVNSFGTDEFIRMCRSVGAEPLIVVNLGMHDARQKRPRYCQDARDWLEYCNGSPSSKWGKVRATNGHPQPYGVKYWEIDNEVWRLSPDDYVSVVKQFVPAMKKVDPSIIIAACGSGQLGGHWGAGDAKVVAECAEIIDYLSVHHYENPNRFADGPVAAASFWRHRAGLIAQSSNPKVKLYVSEWNAQSTDWRTGLYCGGILNVFERCGEFVGMAGPALFLRHASARSWDNAFINFDHRTWFPAPNYVVMKLWREHYAPCRLQTGGDARGLHGVATKSADGNTLYYKVVNPGKQPVPVVLTVKNGFRVRGAAMQLVAPDSPEARNTLDEPHKIRPVPAEVQIDGQRIRFTLPRWSAGVVTVNQ